MIGLSGIGRIASGIAGRVSDGVAAIRIDPPAVPLSRAVLGVALSVAVGLGAVWWIKRERDQFWRERIAASSQGVRAEIERGKSLASMTDDEIIRGLSDVDERLQAAEMDLASYRAAPRSAERDRCRIPAECLRAK